MDSSIRIGTVKRDVGVALDAEARLVERRRPDTTVFGHRLAEQLGREHRHHLGGLGVHHQELGKGRVVAGDDEMIAVDARSVRHDQLAVRIRQRRELEQLGDAAAPADIGLRSAEHTSELQSLMRSSYAVVWLTKKKEV